MAKFKIDSSFEKETKSYMKDVIKKLSNENNEIENDWISSLQMLAENYNTFILSSNQIKFDGITIKDRFGSVVAHPALKIRNDANIQVLKLLIEFGLTKKSAQKVVTIETEEDSPLISFVKGIKGKKEKR